MWTCPGVRPHVMQPALDLAVGLLAKLSVDVRDHEIDVLVQGVKAFFCVLAAYFMMLPIRDSVAVAIGTQYLPSLFVASFVLTACVVPLVSSSVFSSPASQPKAMQILFKSLASSVLGFYLLHIMFFKVQGLQLTTYVCFYLWISLLNNVSIAILWAAMADVFHLSAGVRLFGFLGGGATAGQLFGSIIATLWNAVLLRTGAYDNLPAIQVLPLVGSAILLCFAGRATARLRPTSPAPQNAPHAPNILSQPRKIGLSVVIQSMEQLSEGFRLIAASGYLCHLCCYLVLNTFISSFMYFQKTLVVAASARSSSSRMAAFASMNGASAVLIAALQFTVTGPIMKRAGVATALAASPAVAGAMMLAIAARPTPLTVGVAEVSRKIAQYVMSRPAREVLFTVVTREEKVKAKVCIDTLVLRLGDLVAAAAFHVLNSTLSQGPREFALLAVPICFCCAFVAYSLGSRQQRLAFQQQEHAVAM